MEFYRLRFRLLLIGTAVCQLQELSLKAERNTYIWPI